MKTLGIEFFLVVVGAWFIGAYLGAPLFLALLVVWKGITGNGNEAVLWGLIVGALLGVLMLPLFVWWFFVMGSTGLMLYLLRKYLIFKLTPVTITFFALLSLFFWYACLAVVRSGFSFRSFLASMLFDASVASILINLCYAIFHQKKGAYQLRLWERSPRGIIRFVR